MRLAILHIPIKMGSSSILVMTFILSPLSGQSQTFSMKFSFNFIPGSWSFLFFLLVTKYEISPKLTLNPISPEWVAQWQPDYPISGSNII
jgi:hypothetical protein